MTHAFRSFCSALLIGALASHPAAAAHAPPPSAIATAKHRTHGVDLPMSQGTLSLQLIRANVLRVHFAPEGKRTPPTLVMAPDTSDSDAGPTQVYRSKREVVLRSTQLQVVLDRVHGTLTVRLPGATQPLLTQTDLGALARGRIAVGFAAGAPLYGIGSFDAFENAGADLLRTGTQIAKAGHQGHAGAPLVWSTDGFAVLVDSKGASFDLGSDELSVDKLSRPDATYYLIAGEPKAIFAAVADLSGHAQLFPKWAMGFTNSQWGIDQKELLDIVRTYRTKHIPIDNFTLDFDWKAWGEDHYGEFRWNPVKFPDGPSGQLAKELAAEGMQLTGIMKPRIHVDTVEGRYATDHDLWVPGEKVSDDYFSHKPVKDVDFDLPLTRTWFGDLAMKYAFDQGIVGWWNDEADETGDDTQFLNMQRSLYDAQRKHTDVRVWSVNRNFWLGSQRYAYGLWSGDIETGFASMAGQRQRMLASVDVGAMLWGMDTGGFKGHPSNENYARWMQFAAFVPIFRVHGVFGEKRQPWHYGDKAERAATAAIRLRYRLLPYVYAYAWQYHAHGVGLVRPLTFDWPHDPKVRNDVDAWMFGESLLVSPVVQQGQTHKQIYLPAGAWTDWFTGKRYAGGQTVTLDVDSTNWSDIPLFIRQGAIIPTQPVMDYVDQHPVPTVSVDVFPATHATHFDYYDDDGRTYAYERGVYYLQRMDTQRRADGSVRFALAAPTGSYAPALRHYLVKIHGTAAHAVAGLSHRYADLKALRQADGEGWATGSDRYGPVTWIRMNARHAQSITLR
ncbi:TIM-barrel domain-containing protein [Oleiagrimonas soli]|uniref:Alpha-glucosidase (Family GH31 glycosyl hydrolase) n=1 Tax=Oleiagrimonas soli TaxID=1543381 RepID=A0A099CS87_9GAMM|nr:TIM-barrel domain-containing protein [Oleiagrimonas soli]KGI76873.1 glycoside hydrolase family 31 [Oleiagrimonas soli]MBB6185270.1 alpha-glucosidase (family GH31 glycosyl hydrolase) [Oleiagrimonas soli]